MNWKKYTINDYNKTLNKNYMVRTEKELLSLLFNTLHSLKEPETITKKENDLIEQYRDDEGFINLKNVDDINEMKRVFSIVDKKNFLEQLMSGDNNIQNLADTLAKEMALIDDTKSVNVRIETPNGEACANAVNSENIEAEPSCNINEEKIVKEAETENAPEAANDTVVLYEVGGMYNPSFYNAALYICETLHFPSCSVYSEDEMTPDDPVKTHILLPNVWGKIFAGAAEEFGERLKMGEEVFILDPETFELIKINNSLDLWDYAMTKVQEETL